MPIPKNENNVQKPINPPTGGSGVSKNSLKGNYVPKGFRGELVGFVLDTGEETFIFNEEFYIKAPMSPEEESTFKKALDHFKHTRITIEELHLIAANPDNYDSLGTAIAVPEMSNEQYLEMKHKALSLAVKKFLAGAEDMTRSSLRDEAGRLFASFLDPDEITQLVRDAIHDARMKEVTVEDKVNHPSHYNQYKGLEIIDLTEQLNFNRGNAVKYIARAGFKDKATEIQDLQKAEWYVRRELHRLSEITDDYQTTADATALAQQMNYNRGSAVARISHAGTWGRDSVAGDLEMAVHHLVSEINRLERDAE